MASPTRHHWKRYIGFGLIGLSGLWFAGTLAVPALPFSLAVKGGIAVALVILMEVSFWLGSIIVGREAVARIWRSITARRHAAARPDDAPCQTDRVRSTRRVDGEPNRQ